MKRRLVSIASGLAAVLIAAGAGFTRPALADDMQVVIGYLSEDVPEPDPLSLVEVVATDKGVAGVRLGLEDNQSTGRFLKQSYDLKEDVVPEGGSLAEGLAALTAGGARFIIADLSAARLLELADLPAAKGIPIFNIRAEDDSLRTQDCRPDIFNVAPSRAMKADALGQYLLTKKWTRWVLVSGSNPADKAYAEAVRRAAKRFGAQIVAERTYEFTEGSRRSDTGEQQIRQQMGALTQRLPDYDVLVVADESEVFGEYLPYRTWDPRPVVGTQGLTPTAWHRSQEQWGGTQLQHRFTKSFKRFMLERDYSGWLAIRAIGEAVTRTGKDDPASVEAYLRSDNFVLGAFKGVGVSFRKWDQQLRQPILLASPMMLVSVSPQEGFLNPNSPLDTLGYDAPESACKLNP